MSQPQEILYHYTTQNGLLGILKNRKIWATNILFLNDSKEFNHTLELAMDFLKDGNSLAQQDLHSTASNLFSHGPSVYVTSLTAKNDQLSQWRGYCPNMGGFNIGFETKKLINLAKTQDFILLPCNYDIEQQKEIIKKSAKITCDSLDQKLSLEHRSEGSFDIDSFLGEVGKTRLNYGLQLLLIAHYFKHPKFFEEEEWRLIYGLRNPKKKEIFFREGTSMVIPYVEFELSLAADEPLPIKEIVIGPTPNQELSKKSVEKLVMKYEISSCNVVLSEIPYRVW